MKKTILFFFLGLNVVRLWSQPQYDTTLVYANYTPAPVVIDGVDNDSCWSLAQWHNIDKVWIPYNATVDENDFKGAYKVAWDSNYLYLLVKIVDDSLADYFSNPLSNWWNDDCVEIFLDEDRSKGYHECSYNAFAYHVSIFYDAIDMSTSCAGINLRNNMMVK
ncbi:MAG: sugar-binding protein, partial [Bacteroidales bacterium]